jgi:hypothetical protein
MTATPARRHWFRRLLTWVRIEDEHGVLSLTTTVLLASLVWLVVTSSLVALGVFAVAFAGYHGKRHQRYMLARLGIHGANRHAVAQLGLEHGDQVKALAAKMKDMAAKVDAVLTPERLEAFKTMLRRGQ